MPFRSVIPRYVLGGAGRWARIPHEPMRKLPSDHPLARFDNASVEHQTDALHEEWYRNKFGIRS